MQQRRLRPGDVLDDYCPRERRITDHAIVAMIEDDIKQTRCVSCDTEHEYKQAKVPPQRRKKAPPALFTQVLDGLQGPARIAQANAASGLPVGESGQPGDDLEVDAGDDSESATLSAGAADDTAALDVPETSAAVQSKPTETVEAPEPAADEERVAEDGPVRRPLIRAQLPRHEGQPPPTRDLPDFTIRQPTNGRGNRPGGHGTRPGAPAAGRRRGGGHQQGPGGATRFGGGQARSNQFGRSNERRHGSRPGGPGHGQGQGHGPGQGPGQGQSHGGRPNRGGGRRGGGGKKP